MSHTVIPTVLINGPRTALVHYYIASDGVSNDLQSAVILEPADLFGEGADVAPVYTINQIWKEFSGFDALLSFDGGDQMEAWVLSQNSDNHIDFRCFGGLKDQSTTDATGKLLLSTNGLNMPNAKGTMIVELKK